MTQSNTPFKTESYIAALSLLQFLVIIVIIIIIVIFWTIVCMPDRWCSYLSPQKESHRDPLFLPLDHPLLGCLVAIDLEGQILFHRNPSLISTFKTFRKMRCQRFSTIMDLQPPVSSHCRQTVRGFLHLTLGVFLVKEAAGSWYFDLFLPFLLSPRRIKTISSLFCWT